MHSTRKEHQIFKANLRILRCGYDKQHICSLTTANFKETTKTFVVLKKKKNSKEKNSSKCFKESGHHQKKIKIMQLSKYYYLGKREVE